MIKEFWIINTSGICLFHRSVDSNVYKIDTKNITIDTELFSGLLTAILNMYSELSSTEIQKLEGEGGKFLFFRKQNLIYIVRSQLNDDDKKIKKKIEIIQNLFIEKYDKQLEEFDGDITSFSLFETDLNEIFKKLSKPEKWGKGILEL